MQAKEIKNGSIVVFNGSPVIIESISVHSPSARGAATLYKFKGRNIISKQKVDLTLKGSESLDEANFERRQVSMMYSDAAKLHLLDSENFNQYSIDLEIVEDERQFIKEGLEGIQALIYNDECVGIQIPATVELTVVECDPGVRGNSATSRTKLAKLETGVTIQVPEYLKQGEKIKIDTRTGEFLSRS